MFPAEKVKNFEFWKVWFEEFPIFEPPFFVRFSLFLKPTNSENLVHLPLMV